MDSVYLLIVAGGMVAGFVQGLSGFAFSMTAMSFWVWGMDPVLAASLSVFGALTGQIIGVFTVRRRFEAGLLLPFLAGGLVGVPVGVSLLPLLEVNVFKLLLGMLLVLWCPAMLFMRRLPRISAGGRFADGVAGLLGGVMGGFAGISGTIPTLWCTLRGMQKEQQRAVIQNFNLGTLAFSMLAYLYKGIVTVQMLPYFAVLVPAMLVPTILGARVYHRVSPLTFQRLVLTLLTLSGVALLSAALPPMLTPA